MRLERESNGERVSIDSRSPLGVGGEARVFAVAEDRGLCAKIYHRPTHDQPRKLAVMVANPPDDPMIAQGHISIAWPIDLLRTMYGGQQFAGFLMPRVEGMRPLFNVYNPVTRRRESPRFDYRYLHRAARNVSLALRALHGRGYVVGDINESNILVSETALVTLVDTDSFQARDPVTGRVYRCPVGKPDYTPPELQNLNFRQVDRAPEHDHFGLAVLIFQLLMEGTHPYSGIYEGGGDPPAYDARIQSGHYTYGSHSTPYRPMPLAPAVETLPPSLFSLFVRAFETGHTAPGARPTPNEWSAALKASEEALVACRDNPRHWYGGHLNACPWCRRRDQLGGRDPFPAEAAEPIRRTRTDVQRTPRTGPGTVNVGFQTAVRVAPQVVPAAPLSATNLPPWPLAPTGLPPGPVGAGGNPVGGIIAIPPYHGATWVAGSMAILAVLLPGFRVLSGLIALICGVIGWRQRQAGRSLAGVSAVIGALVVAGLLTAAVGRSVLKADVRAVTENGPIRAITFSPDSTSVVTATERNEDQRLITGQVAFYNTTTGDLERTIVSTGDMASVTYSPDGRTLAAGTGALLESGIVRLWDARTGSLRANLTGFRGDVESIAFTPDSRFVVTGSRDGELRTWDSATGRLLRSVAAQGDVFGVAVSPDGRLVATGTGSAGSGLPGQVSVWDFASGRLIWSQKAHSEQALAVAFSPDGSILASAGNDNTLRIWDPHSGRMKQMLEAPTVQALGALAFSPDGAEVVTGGNDGITRLWDLRKGVIVRMLTPTVSERSGQDLLVQAVAYSRDGRFIASGARGGTFHIWRLR